MRGLEKNCMERGQTLNKQISSDGHRDYLIESAQWANSMKILTAPKVGPRKTVSVIAFRIAVTPDVKS